MPFLTTPNPHFERTRKLLSTHPEVKKLIGPVPSSSLYIVGIVALQVAVAFALKDSAWWVILIAAYTIGAAADHALWVMIHESTHNLIFKKSWQNQLLQIFANFPIIFPSAISFRIYHINHHIYQGDIDVDADLARDFEARWVGNSTIKKTIWMLFFCVSQLARIPFLKRGVVWMNRWIALNWICEVAFLSSMVHFFGWSTFGYYAACSVFSIGLHPMGARWIQEHYIMKGDQETYSYYGPLNILAFNVGFHNEHHDVMGVPWMKLPLVRKAAPEMYDTLYFHKSWSKLMWKFLTDPTLRLDSRVYRNTSAPREGASKLRSESIAQ